ncbi:MAG TPA: hypothetical protein ENK98_03325 [Epsilonproteobacteria bacterium]|nr:hypothetical protein [Campylobacterota bacterium]HHH53374.1 hypothetical protein [Bacteroidota bacterium]
MKLKKIVITATIMLLFSGCSSKDEVYRTTYNWLQDDKFCINARECEQKRLHQNGYKQTKTISYDEYKKSLNKNDR